MLHGNCVRGVTTRGASTPAVKHCVGASSGPGRGITAAWNWRFVLIDALCFVLVNVNFYVCGVTVVSVGEHSTLLACKPS